jgi:hypothetical protein
VYYSDDGGETYKLSNSTFPRADEASLTALNDSNLVVNQRLSADVITICFSRIWVLHNTFKGM